MNKRTVIAYRRADPFPPVPNPAPRTNSLASSPATSPASSPVRQAGLRRSPDAGAGVGEVWSLDVTGLDSGRLAGPRGVEALKELFEAIIAAARLHPVAEPIWHLFDGENAGVTGIVALSESHLACHTFPEHGGLTLDLYTCVARTALAHHGFWEKLIGEHLGSSETAVEVHARTYARRLASPVSQRATQGASQEGTQA